MNVIPLRRDVRACTAAVATLATDEVRGAITERSDGNCEMCESAPVAELHHLIYQPVDPSKALENLFALCRACHAPKHEED